MTHNIVLIDQRAGNGDAGGWVVRCSNDDCFEVYESFRLKREAVGHMKGMTCPEGIN